MFLRHPNIALIVGQRAAELAKGFGGVFGEQQKQT
jgi:hypothetical protein